jgi:Alginate export
VRSTAETVFLGHLFAFVGALLAPLLCTAQVLRDPPTPFGPLRYDDPAEITTGVSVGLKDFRFGDDLTDELSVGGSVRERVESWQHPFVGYGGPDQTYLLSRVLVEADARFDETARVFIQFGNHWETGRQPGPMPTDIDRLDVQQGFVDLYLSDPSNGVRLGRQEMIFGSNRLIDIREGPNIRQSFDGVRGWTTLDGGRLDVFWNHPTLDKPGDFDDEPDPSQQFWGVYLSAMPTPLRGLNLDIYYLGLWRTPRSGPPLDAGPATETRHTVGTRLFGGDERVDYNFEAVYQFGSFSPLVGLPRHLSAWAFFSETGLTLTDVWRTRLALRADVMSGGDSRGGGTLGTFYPLFPKNNMFSESNIFTEMNAIHIHPYVQVQPRPCLALMLSVWPVWRENRADAMYTPPGAPLVPGNVNRSTYAGTGTDVQVEWQATPNVDLNVAFSYFSAGSYFTEAEGYDTTWAGFWITFNF